MNEKQESISVLHVFSKGTSVRLPKENGVNSLSCEERSRRIMGDGKTGFDVILEEIKM